MFQIVATGQRVYNVSSHDKLEEIVDDIKSAIMQFTLEGKM